MATEFNYLADKMHSNLGVNLNRQKYAPLDGSSVFKSIADFEYYIKKGAFDQQLIETAPLSNDISDYVLNIMTQYPYVGQIVSIVDSETSSVSVYKITDVASCEYTQIDSTLSVSGSDYVSVTETSAGVQVALTELSLDGGNASGALS